MLVGFFNRRLLIFFLFIFYFIHDAARLIEKLILELCSYKHGINMVKYLHGTELLRSIKERVEIETGVVI